MLLLIALVGMLALGFLPFAMFAAEERLYRRPKLAVEPQSELVAEAA